MDQAVHEMDPNDALLISCDALPWSQMVPGVELKLLRCSEETGHDALVVDEEIILYMTSYGSSAFLNPDDSVQFWLDDCSHQPGLA